MEMKRDFYIGDQRVLIHRASRETHGASAIFELHHPANHQVPLHYHRYEIEHFYILEGSYAFTLGDKNLEASVGQLVTAPVNTPHRCVSQDSEMNRMLVFCTPGGLEKYFELMSYIKLDDPDRNEKCSKIDKKFGIVLVN